MEQWLTLKGLTDLLNWNQVRSGFLQVLEVGLEVFQGPEGIEGHVVFRPSVEHVPDVGRRLALEPDQSQDVALGDLENNTGIFGATVSNNKKTKQLLNNFYASSRQPLFL